MKAAGVNERRSLQWMAVKKKKQRKRGREGRDMDDRLSLWLYNRNEACLFLSLLLNNQSQDEVKVLLLKALPPLDVLQQTLRLQSSQSSSVFVMSVVCISFPLHSKQVLSLIKSLIYCC